MEPTFAFKSSCFFQCGVVYTTPTAVVGRQQADAGDPPRCHDHCWPGTVAQAAASSFTDDSLPFTSPKTVTLESCFFLRLMTPSGGGSSISKICGWVRLFGGRIFFNKKWLIFRPLFFVSMGEGAPDSGWRSSQPWVGGFRPDPPGVPGCPQEKTVWNAVAPRNVRIGVVVVFVVFVVNRGRTDYNARVPENLGVLSARVVDVGDGGCFVPIAAVVAVFVLIVVVAAFTITGPWSILKGGWGSVSSL